MCVHLLLKLILFVRVCGLVSDLLVYLVKMWLTEWLTVSCVFSVGFEVDVFARACNISRCVNLSTNVNDVMCECVVLCM